MLRHILLFFFVYFSLYTVSGQSAFMNGYVINLNGDTTYLQIKNQSLGKKAYIKVKQTRKVDELPLEELRYFHIFGYELFKVDSSKAYNVLLKGKISLYTHDGSFWLEKDGQKVRLKTEIRSMEVGGLNRDVQVPVWRNEIGKLTGSCTLLEEDHKLHKQDLIAILEAYHLCAGEPYNIIKHQKMTFITQIQAGVELTQSIVNVNKRDQEENPIFPIGTPDGLNFFLAEKYYSSDLFYNFNLSLFFERKRQFAIETGVNLGSADFSATAASTVNDDFYHSLLEYNSFSIPISLRYENQIGNLNLFVSGGIIYSFISESNIGAFIEDNSRFGRIITRPGSIAALDSKLFGLLFQAGAKYNIKDFYAGFAAKYYAQAGFNELNTIEAIYNKQSLAFFLGYTLNNSK